MKKKKYGAIEERTHTHASACSMPIHVKILSNPVAQEPGKPHFADGLAFECKTSLHACKRHEKAPVAHLDTSSDSSHKRKTLLTKHQQIIILK